MSNRTYYRGPDAVVTDKLFVWRTPPSKGFAVQDLRRIGVIRCEVKQMRPYAAIVAGAALVLVAATWTKVHTPAAYAISLLAIGLPALLTIVALRARPHRWELRARYRGVDVVLYASSDARVFNQVARALRRAVEDARPPTDDYDLAAA